MRLPRRGARYAVKFLPLAGNFTLFCMRPLLTVPRH
jgi:hypothetical protein